MKKIYALFAVVLVSTTAFAIEPGDGSKSTGLAVVKKNESTFNLFYRPAGVTDVKVLIQDSKGKEIYSEKVRNTDGFTRPYTFSNLEEGEYSMTVVDGENRFTEKLSYGKPIAKKSARVVKIDGDRYLIAIPASQYSGTAEIRIYDGDELAHHQTVKTAGDYGQVFNVKNLTNAVTFEVTDNAGNKIN